MPIWGTMQIGALLDKMNRESVEISLKVDKETPFEQIGFHLRWAYYFVKIAETLIYDALKKQPDWKIQVYNDFNRIMKDIENEK